VRERGGCGGLKIEGVTFEARFRDCSPVRMPLNWTDRVDSMLNEPLCPVTRAPDKSNNFTERSKGAYRPRERSKMREKEEKMGRRDGRDWQSIGKGILESPVVRLPFPIPPPPPQSKPLRHRPVISYFLGVLDPDNFLRGVETPR